MSGLASIGILFAEVFRNNLITSALSSFFGLENVDRTIPSDWIVSSLIVALGCVVSFSCFHLVEVTKKLPLMSQEQTELLVRGAPSMFLLMTSVMMAIYYWLAKRFDEDMRILIVRAGVEAHLEILKLPRIRISAAFIIIFLILVLVFHISDFEMLGVERRFRYLAVLDEGSASIFFWYVAIPIISFVLGLNFLGLIAQSTVLTDVAKTIKIDLHGVYQYYVLANSIVRMIVSGLVFTSGVVLIGVFIGLSFMQILTLLPLVWMILLPLISAFGRPVWIVAARIRFEKERSQQQILDELKEIDISTSTGQTRQTYLMTKQMFVESRNEWPVSTHLKTIVLFGLMPPITWVLAAMIEKLLFG